MSIYFSQSIKDYRFLKNRNYSTRAALKLVGDRYRLTRLQRNCLFRGITSDSECASRLHKIIQASAVTGKSLGTDWYNVLITVESYLKGSTVFLSDDGVIRDSSGIHGSYRPSRITDEAVKKIFKGLNQLGPNKIDLFLDSPIPFSGQMAELLRNELESLPNITFSVTTAPSADYALKKYKGVVATSDSVIMDNENIHELFDLAGYILKQIFKFKAKDLNSLFHE